MKTYLKPKRTDIIASKSELDVRRFFQWIVTTFALYMMLPAILLTFYDFLYALITWIAILFIVYFVVNPVLKSFNVNIIDKLFDREERYRKQIVERLLYWYSYKTDMGWNEAKKYVDYLAETYPTAIELENWLDS